LRCEVRFLRGTSSARPPRLPAAEPQRQWRQDVAGFFRIRGSYTKEKLFPQCGAAVSTSRREGILKAEYMKDINDYHNQKKVT
jgi:hypothetical protein